VEPSLQKLPSKDQQPAPAQRKKGYLGNLYSKFFKTDTANEWDKEKKRASKKKKQSVKKAGATNMVINTKMSAGEGYQEQAQAPAMVTKQVEQTAYVPVIPPAPKPRSNKPYPQPKSKCNVKPRPTTFRPTAPSAATRPVAAPQQVA
jgi:hypothetical protein